MRTLKYAILGLLMQSPMTGYDISKAFGVGLGSFGAPSTVRSIRNSSDWQKKG